MTSSAATRDRGLSFAEHRALGPLAVLLAEPQLRDILINAHEDSATIWIDRGRGLEHVKSLRPSSESVRELAITLIGVGGRHLDELNPCENVRIGEGIRVHAVLAPIVRDGTAVSIRFPNTAPRSLQQLIEEGLGDARVAHLLHECVARRRNVLVTGATGSGKTTLLAALLGAVCHSERIVSIEDVQELRIAHPHHIALEARRANAEGRGRVTLENLLAESLRMRPDRIVVGECRGAELVTLMSALNSGHAGGAGTLHANSIDDVPARLEALGMLGGLTPAMLARQAVSGFHRIVHLERTQMRHRVAAVASLRVSGDGLLTLHGVERMAEVGSG